MHSLSLLIVELENARRRLLYIFGASDGTPTSELGIQPVPEAPCLPLPALACIARTGKRTAGDAP